MANEEFGGLCENGHDVRPGARFCPACGAPAHAPSPETASQLGLPAGWTWPPEPPPPATGWWPSPPPGYWNGPASKGNPRYGPPPAGGYGPLPPAGYPYSTPASARYRPPPGAGPVPYFYPVYRRARSGTNGFAIASLVLGVLWFWWLGSVLAVVFGHLALHQIRSSGQGGRGMAIAGMVLGYVGVFVAAVMVIVFKAIL